MINEELDNIRLEYNQLINMRKELIEKLDKIKILEENEDVKKYLSLLNEMENDKNHTYSHLENASETDIVKICISRVRISETNNIYVYTGTYKYNLETDIVHGSHDLSVSRDDESAIYSEYKNLELQDFKGTVTIPISKREEFEKNNFIIYPKTYFKDKFFYELQIEFFKDAIENDQHCAISNVLSKNKKQI